MAGDWIKLKSNLDMELDSHRMARAIGCDADRVAFLLYRLAGWFKSQGKYGKMAVSPSDIDFFLAHPGFAASALSVGYLIDHDGVLALSSRVADVSACRKSLGQKIRTQVLDGAKCAACGASESLEIDHAVPIVRGGSCNTDNLQALCRPCNRAKGRKTMQEFLS